MPDKQLTRETKLFTEYADRRQLRIVVTTEEGDDVFRLISEIAELAERERYYAGVKLFKDNTLEVAVYLGNDRAKERRDEQGFVRQIEKLVINS